jgi:DNA polymerase III alpha subunit
LSFDVDIDFADREQILKLVAHSAAMQKDGVKERKHNTGVYFHHVPTNPFTGLCTLDYKQAEDAGWFKIDLLNVGIYSNFNSNEQIDDLLSKETVWELLEHREVIQRLFHIHNHADTVIRMKPRSIEQLAMVLAVIRPGKKHLIGKTWTEIEKEVWTKTEDVYSFKKSHAIGYAAAIALQLNELAYSFDSSKS